jgi:DNA repair exonuclease SbcCD ATPase subunit
MADYHSGLRPNEYYRLSAEIESAKQELQRIGAELTAVRAARQTIDERLPFQGFNPDPSAFASDIDRLLSDSEGLAQQEDQYRVQVQELRGRAATIDMQIRVVEREARELRADLQFATELPAEQLECPVCGTIHENSFAERFAIARDEDRCRDLLGELRTERDAVAKSLEGVQAGFERASGERIRLEGVLATRRGDLQLKDIIEAQGRTEVQRVFSESIRAYTRTATDIQLRIQELERGLRGLQDKQRQAEILGFYRARMREYLNELDVQNLSPKSYANISSKIREIGSDKPRALLAYYYSFLQTMSRFSSSVFCPIVIDEPNQQGLDPQMLPRVLNFIYKFQPVGSQLILGVENLHGVEAPGLVVELRNKWRLLRSEEFASVADEVRPMLTEAFRLESEDGGS